MAAIAKTVKHHKAAGNYRSDRHSKTKPTGNLVAFLPDPPLELDETAQTIYKGMGAVLIASGVLNDSDVFTLACYARESSIYEQQSAKAAGEIVTVLHNGVTCVSHHRRAAETALKNMLALGDRLGLNPKARFSMAAHTKEPEKPEDPWAKFLDEHKFS